MVKVKICGITNLPDAQASILAGCDALGFNFYKKSPRYISPEKARAIIKKLPKKIIKVGVFVNAQEKNIKDIARFCALDILQFHGKESAHLCAKFKNYKIIKTFRIKKRILAKAIQRYKTFAYLFDTFDKRSFGGSGKAFDWSLLRQLKGIGRPVFLAGGLSPENIKQALKQVKPDWVDVCSGVEERPGKKDWRKIRNFIKIAKG